MPRDNSEGRADLLAARDAEIARLHERLEDNRVWQINPADPDGPLIRVEVEPGSIPDGIYCRDETIRAQDAQIARLTAERDAARANHQNLHRRAQCAERAPIHLSRERDQYRELWLARIGRSVPERALADAVAGLRIELAASTDNLRFVDAERTAAREALRLAAPRLLLLIAMESEDDQEGVDAATVAALRATVAILPDALDGAPEWVRKAVDGAAC